MYTSDETPELTEEEIEALRCSNEAYDLLCEAEEKLSEALEDLRQVARLHPHSRGWAEAYIINHLDSLISSWNPYTQDLQAWKRILERESGNDFGDDPDGH